MSPSYRHKRPLRSNYNTLLLKAESSEQHGHLIEAAETYSMAGDIAARNRKFPTAYEHYEKAAVQAETMLTSGTLQPNVRIKLELLAAYSRVFAGKNAMKISHHTREAGGAGNEVEGWHDKAIQQLSKGRAHILTLVNVLKVPVDRISTLFADQVQRLDDLKAAEALMLPRVRDIEK